MKTPTVEIDVKTSLNVDTILMSTGYVTHTLIGNAIVITEFDFNDVQLNTRTVQYKTG